MNNNYLSFTHHTYTGSDFCTSAAEFVAWANSEGYYVDLSIEEAETLLGYVTNRGYCICREAANTMLIVDPQKSENNIIAYGGEEVLDYIIQRNYELVHNAKVEGERLQQAKKDMVMMHNLLSDSRHGVPLGAPTVKELIDILSKLPQDYRVFCCGGENYLYMWPDQKRITIDCEWYLG